MAVAPPSAAVHALDFGPVRRLVERAFAPAASGHVEFEPMPGGASTRRYFRVRHASGTAVAMFVPEGAKAEEIAKPGEHARWPFLEVRDLLAARGVDVPAVYGEDTAQGWLLLEDLGDDTLAAFLTTHPGKKESLYVRAVSDLARAQASLAKLPPASIVSSRAFDEDLLLWEIQHFREWGLEARGIHVPAADRAAFDAIAVRLARTIAGFSRVVVHRDYQSRNLMVRSDAAGECKSLCWIDFQDALLGPRAYDLVALLSDSYQVFERDFVEARLDDYARATGLMGEERAALGREFDRVTVQCKLKDAGRFVFIDRTKGNSSFLKFVEPTIAKVRASLARLSDEADMRALAGVLDRLVPR
jgi:aminoglycoside/choline kinase family phosphotransferase